MNSDNYSLEDFHPSLFGQRLLYNEFACQHFEHEFWVDFKDCKEPILYHYTTLEGFYQIITSRCLWATNVHFLNDSQEYENGKRICVNEVEKCLEQETSAGIREYLKQLIKALEADYADTAVGWSPVNIFSTSFCKEGDLLSQWRGYGRNSGVAIGLDLNQMRSSIYMINSKYQYAKEHGIPLRYAGEDGSSSYSLADSDIKLMEVKYDQEEKHQYFRSVLAENLQFIRENLVRSESKRGGYQQEYISKHLPIQQALLRMAFPGMKDKSFREERECRLLAHFKEEDRVDVSYRMNNGILVPYISYRMLDNQGGNYPAVFPIKEIVIGPGQQQDLAAKGIHYFLTHQLDPELKGLSALADRIRRSEIPFRE